eukprot:GEMP01012246.1.p1 GENE.GEMP01012246.1~~GEMP01012246.1.p1  ORF type:complete len:812 (+),score=146.86 GEMP01012246.1:42-2477(+)
MFLINEEDGAVLDETRCRARVWGGGFGGQCEEPLAPSQMPRLCEFHMAQIKGRSRTLRYGYAFGDVPKSGFLEFQYYNANCLRDKAEVLFLTPTRLKSNGISKTPQLKRKHADASRTPRVIVSQVRSPCAVPPERPDRAKKRCMIAPPLKDCQSTSRAATPLNKPGTTVPVAPQNGRPGKNAAIPKVGDGVAQSAVLALKKVREAVAANTRAAVASADDVNGTRVIKRAFMPPPRTARRSVWSCRGDMSPLEPRRLFASDREEEKSVTAVVATKDQLSKIDCDERLSNVSTRAPSSSSTHSSCMRGRSLSSGTHLVRESTDTRRNSVPPTIGSMSSAARLAALQTSTSACANEAGDVPRPKPQVALTMENKAATICSHPPTRKRTEMDHFGFAQGTVKRAKLSPEVSSTSHPPAQTTRIPAVKNGDTTASHVDVSRATAAKTSIPAPQPASRVTSPEIFNNEPRAASSKSIPASRPASRIISLESPEHKPRATSSKNISVSRPASRIILLETSVTESTSTSSKNMPAPKPASHASSPEMLDNKPRATSSKNIPAPKPATHASSPEMLDNKPRATSSRSIRAPKPASGIISPHASKDNRSTASSKENIPASKPESCDTLPETSNKPRKATKETKPDTGTRSNQRQSITDESHTNMEPQLMSFFLNQPAHCATTTKIASVFQLRDDNMKAACKRALKRLCEFNSADKTYCLKPEFDPNRRTSTTRRSVTAPRQKKTTVSSASKEKTRSQKFNTEDDIRMFDGNLKSAKGDKKKIRHIIRGALIKYHPDKNPGYEETVRPIFVYVMDLKTKYGL